MGSDLIERLRKDADRWMSGDFGRDNEEAGMLSHDAADEITALRATIAKLEAGVRKIEDVTRYVPNQYAKEAWHVARALLSNREPQS